MDWSALLSSSSGGSNTTKGPDYRGNNFGNVTFGNSGSGVTFSQQQLLIGAAIIGAIIFIKK